MPEPQELIDELRYMVQTASDKDEYVELSVNEAAEVVDALDALVVRVEQLQKALTKERSAASMGASLAAQVLAEGCSESAAKFAACIVREAGASVSGGEPE